MAPTLVRGSRLLVVGCTACYAEDPETAWLRYRRGCERTVELLDESHLIILLARCTVCSQNYVSIFTESIDWEGGEDGQHRRIVPVTDDEAADLAEQGTNPDLVALGALGPDLVALGTLGHDRRYLVVDWPTGARDKRIHWSRGRFHVAPGH